MGLIKRLFNRKKNVAQNGKTTNRNSPAQPFRYFRGRSGIVRYQRISGASIGLIAKKAGISKGLIYHYFENKQDILQAILDSGLRSIEDTITSVFQIEDPFQRLVILIERSFVLSEEDERFWRLYTALLLQPGVWEEFKKQAGGFMQKAISQFEQLFRELGVPSPETEARILAGILDGVVLHYMLDKERYPITEVKNALLRRYSLSNLNKG